MPAISTPAILLVTGVNGYIGAHVVKALLSHGHTVRGVVRSESKGEPLKELFKEYGDKFNLVVVPDISAPGAFDEPVKGVTGVVHVGTPPPQHSVTDLDDIFRPAVDGAVSLLRSIQRYGTGVTRFVLTSSAVTLLEPKEGEYTYTEADWNDTAVDIVKKQGAQANPGLIYVASKVLQERAVFEFVRKESPSFDVVALLPVYVFGPPIGAVTDTGSLSTGSLGWMYQAFNNPDSMPPKIAGVDVIVDVRDVAELHVRALITEEASGKRFTLAGDQFKWQDAWDALNIDPKLPGAPVGTPGTGKQIKPRIRCSNKRSKDKFGFEYRSNAETIRDTWVEYLSRGWIKNIKA